MFMIQLDMSYNSESMPESLSASGNSKFEATRTEALPLPLERKFKFLGNKVNQAASGSKCEQIARTTTASCRKGAEENRASQGLEKGYHAKIQFCRESVPPLEITQTPRVFQARSKMGLNSSPQKIEEKCPASASTKVKTEANEDDWDLIMKKKGQQSFGEIEPFIKAEENFESDKSVQGDNLSDSFPEFRLHSSSQSIDLEINSATSLQDEADDSNGIDTNIDLVKRLQEIPQFIEFIQARNARKSQPGYGHKASLDVDGFHLNACGPLKHIKSAFEFNSKLEVFE